MSKEALKLALEVMERISTADDDCDFLNVRQAVQLGEAIDAIKQALAAPVQSLPFGVSGGLVAIKTLLSRDPCVHANTAIEMINAILAEQPAPVQEPVAWMTQARNFVQLMEFTEAEAKLYGWTPVYTTPPAAQPAPEQYTALEQALTRLQKRYGELEAKAAVLLRCWLTDEQKLDVVADYFDHVDSDWAVKKALQLLDAYETKIKELNT